MDKREKGNLFWKIIAILFLIWLYLFLWGDRYFYHPGSFIRFNKFTGNVTELYDGKWKPYE